MHEKVLITTKCNRCIRDNDDGDNERYEWVTINWVMSVSKLFDFPPFPSMNLMIRSHKFASYLPPSCPFRAGFIKTAILSPFYKNWMLIIGNVSDLNAWDKTLWDPHQKRRCTESRCTKLYHWGEYPHSALKLVRWNSIKCPGIWGHLSPNMYQQLTSIPG